MFNYTKRRTAFIMSVSIPIFIRDPIHGSIRVIYEEEKKILDSPFFQRLRYISQLAGAQLVYPSATHTRFAHSIGTMYIAGLYAKQLFPEDIEKIKAVRIAAMIHDIGHGPFSHQFDDAVYMRAFKDVEEVQSYNMMGHDYQRYKILQRFRDDGILTDDLYNAILDIWNDKDRVGGAIVQGVMGADRLDFLLRDSYYSGTQQFGSVPLDRIIKNTFIAEYEGQDILAYSYKLVDDLYMSLVGRFFMYKNVYFHKASRSADMLIQQMLQEAAEPLNLMEHVTDLDKFVSLNEITLGGMILNSDNEKIKALYRRVFFERRLFKMAYELYEPPIHIDIKELRKEVLRMYLEKKYVKPIKAELGDEVPLYPDTLLDVTFFNPDEFTASNVYIYDPKHRLLPGYGEVITMEDTIKRLKYLPIAKGFGIMRLYTEKEYVEPVKKIIHRIELEWKDLPSTKA